MIHCFLFRLLLVLAMLSLCFDSCDAAMDRSELGAPRESAAFTEAEIKASYAEIMHRVRATNPDPAVEEQMKAAHGPFLTNQTTVLVYPRELVTFVSFPTPPLKRACVNGADGKPHLDPLFQLPNLITVYSPRHVTTRERHLEQSGQPAGIYFHYSSAAILAWPRGRDFDATEFTSDDRTAALLSELAYEKAYACGATLRPSDDPLLEQARMADVTAGEFPLQSSDELIERTPSRRWRWKVEDDQWPLKDWLLHTQLQTPNKDRYNLAVCVYRNPRAKRLLVVIRGTESWEDWYSNAAWLWQLPPASWSILLLLLQQFYHGPSANLTANHSVSFAGHSLGAGLAELAACTFGTTATTFDSPGTLAMLPLSSVECARRLQSGEWKRQSNLKSYLSHPGNLVHFGGEQAGYTHLAHQFGAWTGPVAFMYSLGITGCCAALCFVWLSASDPSFFDMATSLFLTGPLLQVPTLVLPVSWLPGPEWLRLCFGFVTVCVSVWRWCAVSKFSLELLCRRFSIGVVVVLGVIAWETVELHRIDLFTDALMQFGTGAKTISRDPQLDTRSKASSLVRWHEYFSLVYLLCFIVTAVRLLAARPLQPAGWGRVIVAAVGVWLLTFPITVAWPEWLVYYLAPVLFGVGLAYVGMPSMSGEQ